MRKVFLIGILTAVMFSGATVICLAVNDQDSDHVDISFYKRSDYGYIEVKEAPGGGFKLSIWLKNNPGGIDKAVYVFANYADAVKTMELIVTGKINFIRVWTKGDKKKYIYQFINSPI